MPPETIMAAPVSFVRLLCPGPHPIESGLAKVSAVVKRRANTIEVPDNPQSPLEGFYITSAHKPIGLSFAGPDQDRALAASEPMLRITGPPESRRLLAE